MFIGSFIGDILIGRPLLLLLIALLKYCRAKRNGYKKVEYQSPKEIKDLFNKAIKDMFVNNK